MCAVKQILRGALPYTPLPYRIVKNQIGFLSGRPAADAARLSGLYFAGVKRINPVKYFITHNFFTMKVVAALAGGLAGTLTVASLHEALRRVTPDAPRMDLLDMELIRKGLKTVHWSVPKKDELQRWAVGGELVGDTSYYCLAGLGSKKGAWFRGATLGLIAGITAVILPKPLGLPQDPSNKTLGTQLMTVGLYLAGGLVAAAVSQLVERVQNAVEEKTEDTQPQQTYQTLPASNFVM